MRSSYSKGSKPASVDSMMTPMIDVVFLLLIFFLSTSSFQRVERALPSSIAAAPDSSQLGNAVQQEPPESISDFSDIVVRIQNNRNSLKPNSVEYAINNETIASLDALSNRLANILKVRSDIPLVIDPADDVSAGDAIRVYDLAKANGSVAVFLVAR